MERIWSGGLTRCEHQSIAKVSNNRNRRNRGLTPISYPALSVIALAKENFIVFRNGRDPIFVALALSVILLISGVGFTATAIADFHKTRQTAGIPYESLLPASIERMFGGPRHPE